MAEVNGTTYPEANINLPEKYVDKIKKQLFSTSSYQIKLKA